MKHETPARAEDRLVRCPHGEACGACAFLGIAYPEQLRVKREMLARALRAHRDLAEVELLDCLPSPLVAAYRIRLKMAVALPHRGGVELGYFRSASREVVDAPDCRVVVPELLETTRRLRKLFATSREIPRELRHIDLRCGSDPAQQHLTLIFQSEKLPDFPMTALKRGCPAVNGISVHFNPRGGPQVVRGALEHLWGEREVWIAHAGLNLRVSPGAFFQVNLSILPQLHRRIAEFLASGDTLADLYAGVGTHGLALRAQFRRLIFSEGVRSAAADLKATLRQLGIAEARVFATSVERSIHGVLEERPEAVVLNPSRAGVLERVLDAFGGSSVERIAYLSCDPETLCRDLVVLRRAGFGVRSIQPIDMMPQTQQIEALALLSREPGPRLERPREPGRPGPRVGPRNRRPHRATKRPGSASRTIS